MATIAARVAAGAAWLDLHEPGWANRIDTERLLMRSCKECVVGQIFGDFDRLFGTDRVGAVVFGFSLPYGDPAHAWDYLEAVWRDLILARRAEGGA
ncbi:MAG TPA: hypothetical protein VFC00_12260 [Micromonosporaceae bacterium]|nr:hypothetical protein [Micromonosporaceae bacterium]